MLKDLLESKCCFKLVCGAGNEDAKEVEKLTALYAKAGCRFFDVSASLEVVNAAKSGLKFAAVEDAYICVSVGIKGDPHINKAQIDYEKCIGCGQCDEICPQKAIRYHKVKSLRCTGCGKCAKVCPKKAISYVSQEKDLNEVLPPLIEAGIDCIELHVMGQDVEEISQKWAYIKNIFPGMLSVCTSRVQLSDEGLVNRINEMIAGKEPYSVIVQADGFPMSGGLDDYKTTLQAVATAEIVQNEKMPVYIMLSGGTNSKTTELAKMCGIDYHGVAVGSYARTIVRKFVERDDFLTNEKVFNQALEIAKSLVNGLRRPKGLQEMSEFR